MRVGGITFGLALLAIVSAMPEGTAAASDFWDEVKTPGLREWRLYVREARVAVSAGQWRAALGEADRAVARLPDRAEAQVVRGRALGELGQLEEAAAAFRRALALDEAALDPAEDGTHAARLCAAASEWELASRILPRVLGGMRINSQRHDLYALYGDVLLSLGPEHLREAVVAYREAVRQGGRGHLRAVIGLALALRRRGDLLEASDLAREVAGQGRIGGVIASLPVPSGEKAARRAIALEANGDRTGSRTAWQEAATFEPWREHAERQLGAEEAPRERTRRRPR